MLVDVIKLRLSIKEIKEKLQVLGINHMVHLSRVGNLTSFIAVFRINFNSCPTGGMGGDGKIVF